MQRLPKIIAILLIIAGVVVAIGGIVTWGMVTSNLAAERITVTDDASCAAGEPVNGPISAFCMAEIINHHALEATGDKTYSELDKEDPLRNVAMNASFLRASLFTSVVAYGVAAFAFGMGLALVAIGLALKVLDARSATKAAEKA